MRDDYLPPAWGPAAWKFLHYCTHAYADAPSSQERQQAKSFFGLLQHMLPCQRCRLHYRTIYEKDMERVARSEIRDPFESRDALVRWLIGVHNEVNRSIGKPAVDSAVAISSLLSANPSHALDLSTPPGSPPGPSSSASAPAPKTDKNDGDGDGDGDGGASKRSGDKRTRRQKRWWTQSIGIAAALFCICWLLRNRTIPTSRRQRLA